MKRFLYKLGAQSIVTAVMLFLVLSPFQALLAQAQSSSVFTNGTGAVTGLNSPVGGATASDVNSGPTVSNTAAATAAAAPAAQAQAAAGNTDGLGNCSSISLCLSSIVYVFTVGIGSAFAYTAAYFFDVAIQLSLNGTAYALTFVSTGWTTARDLANMAFLFILLFIAFQILFSADTANTQQILASVIVIALLVNFSFFFTRLVIDAGNILSIEFYNSIPAGPISASTAIGSSAVPAVAGFVTTSGATNTGSSSFSNAKDLTAAIMNMLQLQGLFNTNSFNAFYSSQQGITGFLVILLTLCFLYIAAAMMMWALAVTFVSVGIKFLIRIVVLWFLIIFSPLAFVARAVPQFRPYFDRWLKELVRHAFYPVAFLFIFLILVNFTNSMTCVSAASATTACTGLISGVFNSITSTTASNPSFILQLGVALANVGLRLGFVLAILYMGLKASESFSVMGGNAAQKAGNWFGGKYKQVAFGTSGYLSSAIGRNTLGRVGNAVTNSSTVRNAATNSVLARAVWRGGGALSRQSFNTSAALNTTGLRAPGASLGKGGFRGAFDDRVKRREEEAKKLKQATEEQTNHAIEGVIKDLPSEQKQRLIDAADAFAQAKEDQTNGDATPADVKNAKKRYNDVVRELGINDKIRDAKTAIGSGNAKAYADAISKPNFLNIKTMVNPADREAALKIRGAKTDGDRVKNILGRLGFKPTPEPDNPEKDKPDNDNDPTKPTTPSGGSPRNTPSSSPRNNPSGSNDNNPKPSPSAPASAAPKPSNENSAAAKGDIWSAPSTDKYKEAEKVKLMRKQLTATENISKVLKRGLTNIESTVGNHPNNRETPHSSIPTSSKLMNTNMPLSNTVRPATRMTPPPANNNFKMPSAANDNIVTEHAPTPESKIKPANDNIPPEENRNAA